MRRSIFIEGKPIVRSRRPEIGDRVKLLRYYLAHLNQQGIDNEHLLLLRGKIVKIADSGYTEVVVIHWDGFGETEAIFERQYITYE